MSDFDWPDDKYFQAKFGWERVKASKVILNYSKLSRFDKPFGGGLAPPWLCKFLLIVLFSKLNTLDIYSDGRGQMITEKRNNFPVFVYPHVSRENENKWLYTMNYSYDRFCFHVICCKEYRICSAKKRAIGIQNINIRDLSLPRRFI